MINFILCGGSGTRLWPLSRSLFPKQFIKFFDNRSLFEMTVERNLPICEKTFIISNVEQYFLALDQIEEVNFDNDIRYLLEPVSKNTAPAIAIACFLLENKEEIVLVTPSDHLIKNTDNYYNSINNAIELAQKDFLVTFGVKPKYPNIGYGYIEAKGDNVIKFHEKPDKNTAIKYLENENFYWNSGIFAFKANFFLSELKIHSPNIYSSCEVAARNIKRKNPFRIDINDMINIAENSIDYAVMEKSDRVKIIPTNMGWSDLGSFDSLYDELEKDNNLNTVNKNHISINSKNNLILSQSRKIATIDIDNLIVVDTFDALLICKKENSEKVKEIVKKINNTESSDLVNIHNVGYRPWGSYTVLDIGCGYKIKRIEVKPGKRLSLQKHFHRNEHWILISGTATVYVKDKTFILRPNESTFIKMGEIHRLSNDGKIPVVLIEVQVGQYTGEDDIVRIEDDFMRI